MGGSDAGVACGEDRAHIRVPGHRRRATVTHDGCAEAAGECEPGQSHLHLVDGCMDTKARERPSPQ
jgi:hypothetical protein